MSTRPNILPESSQKQMCKKEKQLVQNADPPVVSDMLLLSFSLLPTFLKAPVNQTLRNVLKKTDWYSEMVTGWEKLTMHQPISSLPTHTPSNANHSMRNPATEF